MILLVSDSPGDIVIARAMIDRSGLESPMVVAHDGAEALRLLQPDDEREALRPSAILLDLKTPQMNAFDLVIHVRADPHTRDVPVAVLPNVTARTTTGELLSGEEHPHDNAFPKPRSTQELFTALQALGVSWLASEHGRTPPVTSAGPETARGPGRRRERGRPGTAHRRLPEARAS